MLLKEFIKRSIALLLLSVFVISTSGMVMYYHFCEHSHEMMVSVFVDSTSESCLESVISIDDCENHHNESCCTEHTNNNCCDDHKTDSKIAKLKDNFLSSNEKISIEPGAILLPFKNIRTESKLPELNTTEQFYYYTRSLIPISPFGRMLVTQLNSFKVYC